MSADAGRLQASTLKIGGLRLDGRLCIPEKAHGIVLCVDESGSSLLDARHGLVAAMLSDADFAPVLIDLLTTSEHTDATAAGAFRNDVRWLADRVVAVTDWLRGEDRTARLPVGYFGTGFGCAVALAAAAERPASVTAIVACAGSPLLVRAALPQVRAPTLLITLEHEPALARVNRAGISQMCCQACLERVPAQRGDDTEAVQQVGRLARAWFERYLVGPRD
jgi:dienelactone hydrolase